MNFLLNSCILSSVTFVSIFCLSLLTPIHSFHPAFPFFYVHDSACLTRSLLQCDPLHQRVSKPSPFSPHPTCPPHIHPNSIPWWILPWPFRSQAPAWLRAADARGPDNGSRHAISGPHLTGQEWHHQWNRHSEADLKAWWRVRNQRWRWQPGILHLVAGDRWVKMFFKYLGRIIGLQNVCAPLQLFSFLESPLLRLSAVHRTRWQMARASQDHHCPLWHVHVTGWIHPVHEAIPELQPLTDHRWPPDKPDASGKPSKGQHSGDVKFEAQLEL